MGTPYLFYSIKPRSGLPSWSLQSGVQYHYLVHVIYILVVHILEMHLLYMKINLIRFHLCLVISMDGH